MGIFIVVIITTGGGFAVFSPGDSVDFTRYDMQRIGQTGWQVWHDNADGTHAGFMVSHQSGSPDHGFNYYFKLNGNPWIGGGSSSGWSGYGAIGVMPDNNAGVATYHMTQSGDIMRAWVAVDDSQGAMMFTEYAVLPQIYDQPFGWPRIAIDDQGNIHIVLHFYSIDQIFYTRLTNKGLTWQDTIVLYDGPFCNFTGGCFGDRFHAPGKVIVYWTRWTGEGSGGAAQHAQDIFYQVSTDYGATWGSKTNLTQYQPTDTMRAFTHVKAIFDRNGDPHILFPTVYFVNQAPYYKSWIIHWSPSTGFSVVTGPHSMTNNPGAWRLPSDFANITLDRDNDWLYCTYVLNRDSDMSQGGFPNGEIMAKYSTDNGATWISNALGDTGVNLTRTPTPGAPPGQCCDDDYPSMSPYVETIDGVKSVIISYIEDKDAGGIPQGEGTETNNPCRVYFCPVESIIRVEEPGPVKPEITKLLRVFPNPCHDRITINYALAQEGRVRIRILDITGRVVDKPVDQVLPAGYHTVNYKTELPAGIYFVLMETRGRRQTENLILTK